LRENTVETHSFDEPVPPEPGAASQIRQRASEMGRRAADSVDDKRGAIASGIESAASTLREKTGSSSAKVARAASSTAGALETAADYVRERDVRGMIADAGRGVKRHPGATLLTAAAVGFLLARTLFRR
jgi:ElaB/YqjD/DUF883 family membrane-anchored ribosome-binding protein